MFDQHTNLTPYDFSKSMQSGVMRWESLGLTESDVEELGKVFIDFRPFMNPAPFSVQTVTPLTRVYRLYRGIGIRHLPCVNSDNEVEGIITRRILRTNFKNDLS